jgi:ATP-binding cassette subfamily G (WHITE) protein 2
VGGIFFQQSSYASSAGNRINAILFLMCVFSLFCLPAISKLIEDRVLFTREHGGGCYTTFPYFMANFIVEFPILLGIVMGYGVVVYWMVGLEPDATRFVFFLATILMVINVGFSLSQLIASLASSTNLAIAIYMIVLVYSLLLGGFIIQANDLPSSVQWALNTSYFFYGFEALMINEFKGKADSTGVVWGDTILTQMSMQNGNKYVDFVALCAIFLGFRCLAYFGLRFVQREKR